MSSGSSNGRPRGKVRTALVAILASILMPFIMTWRSLRDIWADQASRGILVLAAVLLVAGTVIFMYIESFSALDSFYFCFITLATIGFGDVTPATDLGKIVTVIYGIAGLGIMAALISAIATHRRRLRDPDIAAETAAEGEERSTK